MDNNASEPRSGSTQAIKSQERSVYIVTPIESRRTSAAIAMQVKASAAAVARITSSSDRE